MQVRIWFAVNTFTPTKKYISQTSRNNENVNKNVNSIEDNNSTHKRKERECDNIY